MAGPYWRQASVLAGFGFVSLPPHIMRGGERGKDYQRSHTQPIMPQDMRSLIRDRWKIPRKQLAGNEVKAGPTGVVTWLTYLLPRGNEGKNENSHFLLSKREF